MDKKKATKKMIKVLCLIVVLLIAGNWLISPAMAKAVMEKPVITSGSTICNSDYVRVSAEISDAWSGSWLKNDILLLRSIEIKYTVELYKDTHLILPDDKIATKYFVHRMRPVIDASGHNYVDIYRDEDGDDVVYSIPCSEVETIRGLMDHLDEAPIAKLTISDSHKYYVKVQAYVKIDRKDWGPSETTTDLIPSDTIQINVVYEPFPTMTYDTSFTDYNNDGYLNRNEQFYIDLSPKITGSQSPVAYITFSNSEGLEYDHMKVIESTSPVSDNHVEAGDEIWPKNEHFPLNGNILNPKITAQYDLTDIIIQPFKVETTNKIRVYFQPTSYGTEWFTFRLTVKTSSSSKTGHYINFSPWGDEYLNDQQGYEATKIKIQVTEKELPIFFKDFKPTGWVSKNTPDCSIGVSDFESGVDVSTAEYQYSTNGGSSWSNWKHASCTETGGVAPSHTITARDVPFNQDSKDKNKIKFGIKDKAGNTGTSNVRTVKIDGTRPKTDCTFSPSSPDGENDWYISPVTITLESNDATSGVEWIKYCTDSDSWQTHPGSEVSFTVSNDGLHYITYYAKDKVGNEEEQKISNFFLIDSTKPSASISINSGAEYTNSRSVTLYLSCSDATSGVKDCRYKNEGESWASWESCSLTKSWTLTAGEGTKKVYYQVRDNAGNIKEVYDTIVLKQKGSIYATSNPSGAKVYLDGTYKGTSPITIPNVPVGSHTVKYTKSGYDDCSKAVTVNADQQTNVHCDLVVIPQKGSIYATSNPSGAKVYLDGTYKGTSPITIPNVPVGSHTVKYTKSGYDDCSKAVTVNADQQTNVHCDLVVIPQKGSIYATSNPSGANVYLDGTYKGTSPITISNVPVGSHTVKYTKSGYVDCEKTVTVYANQQANVHCDLQPITQKCKVQITSHSSLQDRPSIVYANGNYYVAYQSWEKGRGIFIKKFDSQWNFKKKKEVVSGSAYYDSPSLVFANNKLYVAYVSNEKGANANDYDVIVKEYNPNSLSCTKGAKYLTSLQSCQDLPALYYKGGYFYLAYQSWEKGNGDIVIKKFDSNWNLKKKVQVTSKSSYQDRPSIIYANGYFYVAYFSKETGNYDIFVKRLDSNLNLDSWKKQITSESSSQSYPFITFVNNEYAIVYASNEGGTLGIYMKKYDRNWNFIGKTKVVDDSSANERRPSHVWDGSNYWVAYVHNYGESKDWNIFAIIPGCEEGASPAPTPSPSCCPSMSISTGQDTYMPGDNVYVSITLTGRSGCTFRLNSPSIVSLIAPTGETVTQTDMAQGITSSIAPGGHHTIGRSMKLPLNAPLGRYDVKVSLSGGKCTKTANGLFHVVTV